MRSGQSHAIRKRMKQARGSFGVRGWFGNVSFRNVLTQINFSTKLEFCAKWKTDKKLSPAIFSKMSHARQRTLSCSVLFCYRAVQIILYLFVKWIICLLLLSFPCPDYRIFFLIPSSMDSAWTAFDVVTQTMLQKAFDGRQTLPDFVW